MGRNPCVATSTYVKVAEDRQTRFIQETGFVNWGDGELGREESLEITIYQNGNWEFDRDDET